MSNFINNLFARSFKLNDSPEIVRPRLPSLFEKPLAGQAEFNTPFFKQAKQTEDEASSIRESIHYNPIKPSWRDPADIDIGAKENSPLIMPIVPQFRGVNSNLNIPYKEVESPNCQQGTGEGINQNNTIEQEFMRRPVQSLFTDKRSNAAQRLENKPGDTVMPNLPISALFGAKQNFNNAQPEISMNNPWEDNESQTLPVNKPDITGLSTRLVTDPALLERLVKEKIALQVNKESPVKNDSANNFISKQSPLLAPADTSNLNIQWPHALSNKQSLDNNNGTVPNPAEPTIQVTIGRIEIRATQATSKGVPKNQDKKPTTMGLEEYLNKRNGGAR